MKFTENKTDDVIIGLHEEKFSTTPAMINLIEFIAVIKESVQEPELRHLKRMDQHELTFHAEAQILLEHC